ncbi:MAG: hypothetical protein NVSMB25_08700 [Thermoleophilaceae bacterium]
MRARTRNLSIVGVVVVLFALALLVIVPGSPLSKPTRLGLDLRGGVELIYQGRPTPKVPKVTPQAITDAINTIRKRTDALGVSEPEIQASGTDQISIGLPAVKNAARAEQQVGTTAQLQFYDWEKSVIGDPNQPIFGLFPAAQLAAKQHDTPEPTDVPAGGPTKDVVQRFGGNQAQIQQYYDQKNDTSGNKYYLFGPGTGAARQIIRPGQLSPSGTSSGSSQANDATAFYESCQEIQKDFEGSGATRGQRHSSSGAPAKDSQCSAELQKLATEGIGPPAGSTVVLVPQGVTLIKQQAPRTASKSFPINQYYVLQDDSELSGSDITDPKPQTDPQTQEPIVTFNFTDAGRRAFARVTKRLAQRGAQKINPPGTPRDRSFQRFAITLDNQVVSLATIDYVQNPDGIDGSTGVQINGIGNFQETNDLAQNLRIGALAVELKLISKNQVSATLGKQALDQGLLAGGVGLALTLLFLLAFYRVLGVIAGATLLIYAALLFAVVKLIPITMTLPGIAGLILTLGVAADANIVIFERVKEEARSGRSIPAAIATGYSKALKTIIDANVVTFGVAFILFMLATAGIKGFAFTLGIGTLVSLFTAVLATQAILGSLARTRLMRSRLALNVGAVRDRWHFDFMGAARYFFSMSGAILAAGAIAIALLGVKFGIDFESGTRITVPTQRNASVQQVRDVLTPLGYGDSRIQKVNDPALGSNVVQISTRKLEPTKVNFVESKLDARFGVRRADFSASSIGPTFGQQIARTALIAIIASLLLISIYIGIRFDFKFAVPVLIALAHDLLITAGVYALTSREVTTSTVAALLTILGYSLYDTIIVFDRIRENVPRMPRATFSQIVNRSMAEVLTRSLVTSFSTLIPITALMLFGGETLKDFGFALLVGVASGTYSSIFIASPVLTHWKEREPVWIRRRNVVRQDHGGIVPAFSEAVLGGAEAPTHARRGAVAPAATGPAAVSPARPAAPSRSSTTASPPRTAEPASPRHDPTKDGSENGEPAERGSENGEPPADAAKARGARRRRNRKHGRR